MGKESETTDSMDEIANFVILVRAGSFSAAARNLKIPKSTISRRISRLEANLGTLLVHRNRKHLVLTTEGSRLYDRVANSVDTIALAINASSSDAQEARGHLRISAPSDFGQLVLPTLLTEFRVLYPDISLEVELSDRFVDMRQERFDLAIRGGLPPDTASAQNLISRKLLSGELVLVGNSDLAKRVSCFDDLKQCPFVLFRTSESQQLISLTDKKGRLRELRVSGQCSVHDYSSMAAFVSAGAGIGLVPNIHIMYGNSLLHQILPNYSQRTLGIVLVYPSRQVPHRARLLIDHLGTRLSSR